VTTSPPVYAAERGPTGERLEDQLGWYDLKSVAAQRTYKRLKVLQPLAAAAVPAGVEAWNVAERAPSAARLAIGTIGI
jgi:hypothetical protein